MPLTVGELYARTNWLVVLSVFVGALYLGRLAARALFWIADRITISREGAHHG